MTDTPVDSAPSTPLPPSGDTPENREAFAKATATALGEWVALEGWQRQAIGALAPRMARSLYLADLTIDAMLDADADETARAEIMAACTMLPEPDELLARLGLCTEMIALPDEGTFVICGTPLQSGRCPFTAHHAPDAPAEP